MTLFMISNGTTSVFAGTRFAERSPAISPSGQIVAYTSDESGTDEVYVRPLVGPGRVVVSGNGGTEPRWAPGGRELYYWSGDTLFAAPVAPPPALGAGARRMVMSGKYVREAFHANYDVAPDGKTFVFIRYTSTGAAPEAVIVLNWFNANK